MMTVEQALYECRKWLEGENDHELYEHGNYTHLYEEFSLLFRKLEETMETTTFASACRIFPTCSSPSRRRARSRRGPHIASRRAHCARCNGA